MLVITESYLLFQLIIWKSHIKMFCPIKSCKKNLLKSVFTKILLKMYLFLYWCPYIRESTSLPHCVGDKQKSYHTYMCNVHTSSCLDIVYFFFLSRNELSTSTPPPPFSPPLPLGGGGGGGGEYMRFNCFIIKTRFSNRVACILFHRPWKPS